MYSIKVEDCFSSAHNLRGYKGKCEELHGHNWKVEVKVGACGLDKAGMVLDFKYLKEKVNKILERLDHKYLNRIAYFKKYNPTSENIAKYIFDNFSTGLNRLNPRARLESVTVWESERSSATYYGE
ncbi:MAG: 6-carboxytetrahydropterin synthase QueD [Candidatus Omnitrophica bacterium]|nr:6-carboxytetrahydropterin synthase QueD [Candidatus Omnitrophota bacterium]MDD5611030.1 6-carboxytetrahydropterin synthase QueD [Candidatus Omnitrophota bacterium]